MDACLFQSGKIKASNLISCSHKFFECQKKKKNKMKPTNPNADTYVEKEGLNTYVSQFPANPLVEHPDLTH